MHFTGAFGQGVFRSLSNISSKVLSLEKKFQTITIFCRSFLLRLDVLQDCKCAHVSIKATSLVQLFYVLF